MKLCGDLLNVEEVQTVGVTLKCGRVDFKLSIGGYQIALLRRQNLTSATLNKSKKGDYYINFVVEIDTQPKRRLLVCP